MDWNAGFCALLHTLCAPLPLTLHPRMIGRVSEQPEHRKPALKGAGSCGKQ